MRALLVSAAILSLVPGVAVRAGDEVPPTPAATPASAPQHVTVPSLPGQPNKEGTVKPEGGMPMDSEGYAITKRYDPNAPAPKASTGAAPASTTAPAAAPAGKAAPAAAPGIPVGPAPAGKMVVTGANTITVRGSLVALEAGKSVTVKLQRTGKENTYTLAPGATIGQGVAPGQVVRVRVLAAEKGKVADRVEIAPPPSPAPAKKEGNS
jgi:hypothetical protein